MDRVPKWVWLLVLGAVLMLPMLGSFGLWDPAEIKHADVARAVAQKGSFGDITVGGKHPPRPVLYVWLVAAGFKMFGVNELAGRLPLALCGLLALLLAYRVGRRLVGEQAGLAGGFVLATTPAFLFQSRQLASDVVFFTAILAAIGGLAAFLAPRDRRRERRDLVIGALGLVAAVLDRGLLLGAGLPLLSIGGALLLTRGAFAPADSASVGAKDEPRAKDKKAEDEDADKAATKAAEDEDAEDTAVVTDDQLLPPLAAAIKPLLVALLVAGAVLAVVLMSIKQGKFLILGGVYRKVAIPPTFDHALRDFGFAFFPWFALAPLMLWQFVAEIRDGARQPREEAGFAKLVIVLSVVLGYAVAVLWPGFFGKLRLPTLAVCAVGVGIWAWQAYQRGDRRPFWGVVAAGLILAVHQDFVMRPSTLAFSHLTDAARYPKDLNIKVATRLFGVGLAALFFLAVSGPSQRIVANFEGRYTGRLANFFARLLEKVGGGLRSLGGEGGRHYYLAAAGGALIFAGWCSLWLTPQLSYHMSNKTLFETYHKCKQGGERLAQYRVSGRGAAYYNNGQVDSIRHQRELFTALKKPQRSFILIPSNYLGSIDQSARQRRIGYFVLDDRNSHYLIISNKLGGPGCEKDKNPLRELVFRTPQKPQKRAYVNWENKLELYGYDLPDSVTRGGSFKIRLYFKVLKRLPANYKIFIHFDKPASRFHGDHKPVGGMYPTQYWLPGDYIISEKEVDIPLLTTPSGRYAVMIGFWQGSRRFKVLKGHNDGVNRSRIGYLRVR